MSRHIFTRGFIIVYGIIAGLAMSEIMLRLLPDKTRVDAYGFQYMYLDIYDPLFKETTINNKKYYTTVRPRMRGMMIPMQKDRKTKRIFIIGESTAGGFDTHILEKKFREVLPQYDFEIYNCGMGGYDCFRTRLVGEQVLKYSPDLIITIVGNSEFWGVRRVDPSRHRGLFSHFKTLQLVTTMFYPDTTVRDNDEADRYYVDNMRKLIGEAKMEKVPVVWCTIPNNYRDFHFSNDRRILFEKNFFSAVVDMQRGKYSETEQRFLKLSTTHEDSYIYHYLSLLSELRRDYNKAQNYSRKALDVARYPMSCAPTRNNFMRAISRSDNVVLADIEQKFIRVTPHGLPGFELFKDWCHPWKYTYCLYSDEIIDALYRNNLMNNGDVLAPVNEWRYDTRKVTSYAEVVRDNASEMKENESESIAFTITTLYNAHDHYCPYLIRYLEEIYNLDPGFVAHLDRARPRVEKALEDTGWARYLIGRYDHIWYSMLYHAGEMFRQHGDYRQALAYFDEAITLKPDAFEPYVFRGLTHLSLGNTEQGRKDFKTAVNLQAGINWLVNSNPLMQ
jgi:tetratricopeptide (TPR) repeat protein